MQIAHKEDSRISAPTFRNLR
jgi:2,3-bisphosphoglycerate-dependent phosphoglycerate mutase